MTVELDFTFEARVTVAPARELGPTSAGLRRVVPITGGSFEGPRLRGQVLPGGADWQLIRPDGVAEIEAHYVIETDDGVAIAVVNRGLRHGPEEVMGKLARGEPVDPSAYYFRTSPTFHAPTGRYGWLTRAIFVGLGERRPDLVIIRVFALR
jgi:hypothetical protein